MAGEQEISFELATPEEYETISDFIFDNFSDMPLFSAFDIANDSRPPQSANGEEDFTVKARTREGTIVGVAVNRAKIVYQNTEVIEKKWMEKMSAKCFSVVPIENGELPTINTFITEHFIDMPVYEALGINAQEDSAPRMSSVPEEPYCLKAIRPDGTIVGVALCDEKLTLHLDENTPGEILKLWDFMQFVVEDSKIGSLPEKTLELRILSVRPDCRGGGIGRRLTEESVKLAKSLGYEMIRICCANTFTEKIAKKLGWEKFYCLEYKDYGKQSGTNVELNPPPPHSTISYYIKRL